MLPAAHGVPRRECGLAGLLVRPALPVHVDLVAGLVLAHRRTKLVGRAHVVVVEARDDVATAQTNLVSRRAGADLDHQRALRHRQPRALANVVGDGDGRHSEEGGTTAPGPAALLELLGDGTDGVDR